MEPVIFTHKQRHVYLKTYNNLNDIKKAISAVQGDESLQISVLGMFDERSYTGDNLTERKESLQKYWESVLNNPHIVGYVTSPDIGSVFVAGALVSTFLHEIDGKVLGEMTTGVSGILRGLGLHQNTVDIYLKDLLRGDYLLIIRGYKKQLNEVQRKLDSLE